MRKGRFSEEQMVGILREADREPVAQVAKKHGISEQTIYTWRQRFSGMNDDEVKRLLAICAGFEKKRPASLQEPGAVGLLSCKRT